MAAELRSTLSTVIDLLGPYVPRPRPLWAIATDAIAGQFLWAGQRTRRRSQATVQAARIITSIGAPMPPPRFVGHVLPLAAEGTTQLKIQRNSRCLRYRVPGQAACGNCPRLAGLSNQVRRG